MTKAPRTYDSVYQSFVWDIPDYFNIGIDVCDQPASRAPGATAIVDVNDPDSPVTITFDELRILSNRLANSLTSLGIGKDSGTYADRVAILLPQRYETAVCHIAVSKMGCIALPLFTLFGPDALLHRLRDSAARAVITDREGYEKILPLKSQLPALEFVLSVDGAVTDADVMPAVSDHASEDFQAVTTKADDPALLIYTSGTTGHPKGVLHAHRVLLGHLPGIQMAFNFPPKVNDRFWTPADWAWIGGLLDVLMPSLHYGVPVVAYRFKRFDPAKAFDLMSKYAVKNAFLPPTALKLMRAYTASHPTTAALRSVGSGGESLSPELISWCKQALHTSVNEFYGQTECNMIVSSCSELESVTPGIMGRAVPGHVVDVIDTASGRRCDDETEGAIAVLSPDPVMFLGYWNNERATAEKFVKGPDGRWLLTGDRGVRLSSGKLKFLGRDDDIINSAGYRIGPGEIEDCLIKHPAIALAGVVGLPDSTRGSIVAAFVTLNDGEKGTSELADDIAEFVKSRLAAHEYPRLVYFIDEMPMTTTGKIIRAELRQRADQISKS